MKHLQVHHFLGDKDLTDGLETFWKWVGDVKHEEPMNEQFGTQHYYGICLFHTMCVPHRVLLTVKLKSLFDFICDCLIDISFVANRSPR